MRQKLAYGRRQVAAGGGGTTPTGALFYLMNFANNVTTVEETPTGVPAAIPGQTIWALAHWRNDVSVSAFTIDGVAATEIDSFELSHDNMYCGLYKRTFDHSGTSFSFDIDFSANTNTIMLAFFQTTNQVEHTTPLLADSIAGNNSTLLSFGTPDKPAGGMTLLSGRGYETIDWSGATLVTEQPASIYGINTNLAANNNTVTFNRSGTNANNKSAAVAHLVAA